MCYFSLDIAYKKKYFFQIVIDNKKFRLNIKYINKKLTQNLT